MAKRDLVVQIRQKNLTWREVDGVIIALDLSSSTYLTTNRTGRVLWNSMVGGATVAELTALLQTSFGIPQERAAADVAGFLRLLDANNLSEGVEERGQGQVGGGGSSS